MFFIKYFNFNDGVVPPPGWFSQSLISGSVGVPVGGRSNAGLANTYGMSDGTANPDDYVYWGAPSTTQGTYYADAIVNSLIPLITPASPPAVTGNIIVNKIVENVPGSEIDFLINCVNLTPDSIILRDGQSYIFTGVAAGSGYEVNEVEGQNYTTEYIVSNGSPHDNITVGVGETVTVTIVNTVYGSITVSKVISPVGDLTEFLFNAGGGLDPIEFSLIAEDEIIFLHVLPGSGYSIVEILNELYGTTYQISNAPDNTNTNITVGPDENVSVVVLNSLKGSGAGIYYQIINSNNAKTNDDHINEDGTISNVKIPDPFFITALIGDK